MRSEKFWLLTANSIYGAAENQSPIAIFTTKEKLLEYIEASKASEPYKTGRYARTFIEGSLLYDYNGMTQGDYHVPEARCGTLVVNPCIHQLQFHEGDDWEGAERSPYPIDPAPPQQQAEAG